MSEFSQGGTAAGWYDDGQGRQRWWDGVQWTDHLAPAAVTPAVQAQPAYFQPPMVVVQQRPMYKTSHGFHLIMSLITFGLWIPVWIIVGITNASRA